MRFVSTSSFSLSARIGGFFRLMRPLNSTVAAVAVIFALFLALDPQEEIPIQVFIFSGFAAFFTTAHGMVVNDIIDYEIDKINVSYRTLPSGKLSLGVAKFWAILLLILACSFGVLIDITIQMPGFSFFWALGNSIILDLYNVYFKKLGLIGNFFVAWPPYALFLYADIVLNRGLTPGLQSIGFVGLFSIFGREVIKGIYDIDGDKNHGINTIAVRFGRKNAAIIGCFIMLLSVPSSLVLITISLKQIVIPIMLIIFDGVLIFKSIKLIKDPTDERAYQTKLVIMQLMLLFLIVLAVSVIFQRYIS